MSQFHSTRKDLLAHRGEEVCVAVGGRYLLGRVAAAVEQGVAGAEGGGGPGSAAHPGRVPGAGDLSEDAGESLEGERPRARPAAELRRRGGSASTRASAVSCICRLAATARHAAPLPLPASEGEVVRFLRIVRREEGSYEEILSRHGKPNIPALGQH
jgi:hypothetical protein